ncbi:MAG TPA: hypothetical protein PLY83_03930, partial [Synergistales bacterium]|nr:hypothetical protein [Synergistales bacterium]
MSWDWILGFTPLSGLILAAVEAQSRVLASGAFCFLNLVVLFFLSLFGSPRARNLFLALLLGMFPVQVLFLKIPPRLAVLHLVVLGSAAGLLWIKARHLDSEKVLFLEFVRKVNGAVNFEEASVLAVRFMRDEFRFPAVCVFLAKEGSDCLERAAAEGFPSELTKVPKDGSVQGRAYRTRNSQ